MVPVITVEGVSKRYRIGQGRGYGRLTESVSAGFARAARRSLGRRAPADFAERYVWALRDITLSIGEGEVVGFIGRNGAGKSTLLKVLCRITEPTSGRAEIRGRVGSLLEVGTGFHPELTGRENIYLNGAILGMRRSEIVRRFDDIVAFSEVERFLDTPVKRYSSGMAVRLAFAVAIHLEPEIMLVDEVLAVGDTAFQRKCLTKMGDVAGAGRTVLFVSHNLATIQSLCQRVYLLERGSVVASGAPREIIARYLDSVSAATRVTIDERPDRKGTGEAHVVSLRVESADPRQPIRAGCRLKVTIGYRARRELRNPRFVVSIYDTTRTGIYFLDSDSGAGLPSVTAAEGTVTCVTEPIAITPGRCHLSVLVWRNGELADWVDDAGVFDVEPEDVFGLGLIPDRDCAVVMIDQTWETRDGDPSAPPSLPIGSAAADQPAGSSV